MDLATRNLPSECFKIRLWYCRWSKFSWYQRPFVGIFSTLCSQKSDLDEVSKVMFEVGEWPWELNIYPPDVLKNVFSEFDEAMFQGVKRPCELFPVSWVRKKRLGLSLLSDFLRRPMSLTTRNLSFERVKNQLCWLPWSDISRCRKAIWTHFLNSRNWKKGFGRSRRSDVLSRRMAQRPHNMPSGRLKNRL
jgi:hypothetical protein